MFGENIKKLRASKGITQKELADALNFTFQNISKWENDISMPDIPTALAIAGYFGVSMDTLLGNAPKEEALTIPVTCNTASDFTLWTDFPHEGSIAYPSENHEGRRRTGDRDSDFAAGKRIRFFLGVNPEGKISTLIAYPVNRGSFVHYIWSDQFYYRPNERFSAFLTNPFDKKRYDILVPKGSFLIAANIGDYRVKQILRFVLPRELHPFVDGTASGYGEFFRYHDGKHMLSCVANGELDHITVALEKDGVRFTKPAEFVNPLYDNIDHLTGLVKERVELSLQEMKTEIGFLKAKLNDLEGCCSDEWEVRCADLEDRLDELEDRMEALEENSEED